MNFVMKSVYPTNQCTSYPAYATYKKKSPKLICLNFPPAYGYQKVKKVKLSLYLIN